MSTEPVYLPALITPSSPLYYFHVDRIGRATSLLDMEDDERRRRDARERRQRLSNEAIVRTLEARESNLDAFPYSLKPATHRSIVSRPYSHRGVNVTLRGDEPSIRSALSVLSTYPPKGPTYINDGDKRFVSLFSDADTCDDSQVPAVGMHRATVHGHHVVAQGCRYRILFRPWW